MTDRGQDETKRLPARRRQRGSALLIVLWAMVGLSVIGARLLATGRSDLQIAANLEGAARAELAADGAIQHSIALLLSPEDAPPGRHWQWTTDGVSLDVTVEDLSGRINPNKASPELLLALLRAAGVVSGSDSLVAAIVDWRSAGPTPQIDPARLIPYRAAGLTSGPPGLPFRSIDELGAVLGMTPARLALLRPHLTVWSESEPNPAAADPVVKAALDAVGAGRAGAAGTPRPVQLVNLSATAVTKQGARFTRRCDVMVDTAVPGGTWRILTWETPNA